MDKTVVEARGLAKKLGSRLALRGVDLEVRAGEVHVLAGPNGAGKTTTLRVILGLLRPDAGLVRVLGVEPGGPGWRGVLARVGYLPEEAGVYERLTGYENLLFYALAYAGGDRAAAREMVERAAEIAGLDRAVLSRRAGEYSKGMRRRLLLARALMHDPDLVVLDEPTEGLDVFSTLRVRGIMRSMASRGAAVLVTTHNLLEAQVAADRVTFIAGGVTVFTGTVREALDRFGGGSLEEAFVRAVGPLGGQAGRVEGG